MTDVTGNIRIVTRAQKKRPYSTVFENEKSSLEETCLNWTLGGQWDFMGQRRVKRLLNKAKVLACIKQWSQAGNKYTWQQMSMCTEHKSRQRFHAQR